MIDLVALATEILSVLNARATEQSYVVPSRQIVTPGSPLEAARDCPMVRVGLVTVQSGSSDLSSVAAGGVSGTAAYAWSWPRATLAVEIIRCAPVLDGSGDPPGVADLTAAGEQTLADAMFLVDVCTHVAATPATPAVQRTVTIGPLETVGPQGGVSSVIATLTVA